jgi:hypothetical protein
MASKWGTIVEEPAYYLESPRVLRGAAALTIAAAVVAVLAVREVAVRILHPDPAFTPLSLGSPVVATIVCNHAGHLHLCRNGVLSEPGPHMASSFGRGRDPVVCAVPIIGDFTHYERRLARGFRSHDDARGSVGDLCNAPTLARDHEAPRQGAAP